MKKLYLILLVAVILALMPPNRNSEQYKCGGCTEQFAGKESFSKHRVRCTKFANVLASARQAVKEKQRERKAAAEAAAAAAAAVAAVDAEMADLEVRSK